MSRAVNQPKKILAFFAATPAITAAAVDMVDIARPSSPETCTQTLCWQRCACCLQFSCAPSSRLLRYQDQPAFFDIYVYYRSGVCSMRPFCFSIHFEDTASIILHAFPLLSKLNTHQKTARCYPALFRHRFHRFHSSQLLRL